MNRELWPHQVAALDGLRSSLGQGKRRPMLFLPTGAGKTRVAATIVKGALRKSKRVIFTVPYVELIDQTVDEFGAEGIDDIGVIRGNDPRQDWSKPVQVASVQTLENRLSPPPADIVIVDEAHRWREYYREWMQKPEWWKVPFVGLSATPWTRGLGKHYDDLISVTSTRELIAQGRLCPFRVMAPTHPDLSGVKVVNTEHGRDYQGGALSRAMNQPHLIGEVVKTWQAHGENRSTLCFAVDRAHGKQLQRQFEAAGIAAGYVDGNTPADERKQVKAQFHDGSLRVVVNVMCLTAGVDWDVRCIILARPTKSEMLYVQIIGRGLRNAEGKEDCLILDHSDTTLRLGFVSDIVHDALDDGKGRPIGAGSVKPDALPKECPSCKHLKPARVHQCPVCGFAPERQSNVRVQEGELAELPGISRRATKEPTRQDKQRWFSMLLHIARARGYAEGWASRTYRDKFNVWPHNMSQVAIPPDREVSNFVKFKLIRFVKSKEHAA